MKNLALFFAILALFASCKKINLAGYNESKTFTVSNFNKIEAHDAIHVVFCDTIDHIIATTDANMLPYLKVENTNQTLKLEYPPHMVINFTTEVIIPFQSGLKQLTLSGTSLFISDKSIETNDLKITLSGGSEVAGQFIISNGNLEIEASGASELALSGFAKYVDTDLSGASKITSTKDNNGYNFVCDELKGELSGASLIQIHCNNKIDCGLSGSSTIRYTGNADTSHCNCSGGSNVVHEN